MERTGIVPMDWHASGWMRQRESMVKVVVPFMVSHNLPFMHHDVVSIEFYHLY